MSNETVPVILKRRPTCTMCGQAHDATGRLLALETERDQFAAACDVFRGRIQALEMERDGAVDALLAMTAERDAARAEGARLRIAVEKSPHWAYCPTMYSPQSQLHGPCACHRAALSGSPSTAEWLAQHDAKARQAVLMEHNFGAFTTLRERVKVLEEALTAAFGAVPFCFDNKMGTCQCVTCRIRRAISTPIADKRSGAPELAEPHRAGDPINCQCADCRKAYPPPIAGGAPKPTDICPRNTDGIHRPWHDEGAEDLCRCGKVVADGAPKPKCATCGGSGVVTVNLGRVDYPVDGCTLSVRKDCPDCKEKP